MKKDTVIMTLLLCISGVLFFASLFVIYSDANRYYPESGQYSPALLAAYCADLYDRGLCDKNGLDQTILIDTREKADYEKGHLLGAVNLAFDKNSLMELLKNAPDDFHVLIYGYEDQWKENKEMARLMREIRWPAAYHVTEGYDELARTEGMHKFLDTAAHQLEPIHFELLPSEVDIVNAFFDNRQ